jgi:aspartyl-tRNA(Asn)/glutamyl-tRNA(Gln) amidotransferase subunit C
MPAARKREQVRLSKEEVEHVALLARLELTAQEQERLTEQLNSILDHFQALSELDTSAVPPTSHVVEITNVFREDEPGPCLTSDQALSGAPDRVGDTFRVPRVVE